MQNQRYLPIIIKPSSRDSNQRCRTGVQRSYILNHMIVIELQFIGGHLTHKQTLQILEPPKTIWLFFVYGKCVSGKLLK